MFNKLVNFCCRATVFCKFLTRLNGLNIRLRLHSVRWVAGQRANACLMYRISVYQFYV